MASVIGRRFTLTWPERSGTSTVGRRHLELSQRALDTVSRKKRDAQSESLLCVRPFDCHPPATSLLRRLNYRWFDLISLVRPKGMAASTRGVGQAVRQQQTAPTAYPHVLPPHQALLGGKGERTRARTRLSLLWTPRTNTGTAKRKNVTVGARCTAAGRRQDLCRPPPSTRIALASFNICM